ncbi:hypothetical protein CAPTEDRAFT_209666 [Capitella teleta]|uniref:CFAP65 fourth Ig-like domain-containing protein n=1 Tax=Capitella teleta TaxID=283909 RepID=R7UVY0_CAPTE|nr:hypothetical protein CAPTEDRAFT_209666 [Capitella teleta]|eukprot:ELU10422.1 hypothetical protein CAPTEDRAFT_209666 [Capitella teleta]
MPGIVAQANNGRVNCYGVELVEEIVWRGWEPGKEYIKNLVLKNVRVKTIKLKFRGPNSRFFTTLYPKPIVLSAGTSYTLPITFRPLEKVFYDDSIDFTTNDGNFKVPLRSVLPQTNIVAPERIDFSMCAAHDFIQVAFEIRNTSEVLTPFQFETKDPFSVSPVEGILEPFATLSMIANFSPKAAVVYDGDIILKYGDDFLNTEIMHFEGVGKYPHLLVSSAGVHSQKGEGRCPQSTVDFGVVPIGKTAERWIDLENLSPVNAPFTIERHRGAPGQLDPVFNCAQKRGLVPALSSARVPISFTPNIVSGDFIEYFHVKTIGNISKTVVSCPGASKGSKVFLNKAVVNFMLIDLGQGATKTIDIVNESDVEATFQFQIDCNESAFKFQVTNGILPSNSRKTIIINFSPTHAINYHRRVACLIHNQDPVFVDLLGTSHSETTKPAVLQAKHLRRFELHNDRGLASLPPEQLNEMRKEGKLLVDGDGALFAPSEDGRANPSPFPAAIATMDEFFNDGYCSEATHRIPQVSLDTHLANFGRCADLNNVEQQFINVTNHTKGKITVVWMGDVNHPFFVSPSEMDIPPQKSSSFTITFKPNAPNLFFGAELECYAFYKSLRDYRLVEDATHCPPWCMTLTATGG